MELDWSTFLLEIVNFLILVWLLKRFLYQPVLNVIARRRKTIEDELSRAREGQQAAEKLKGDYEARLADWEREKRAALVRLDQQLEEERGKRLQQLDQELEQQRLKHRARDEHQQLQWRTQAEAEALQLGASFASRLLQSLSGPELDLRLQRLFIEQLAALSGDALRELREGWQRADARIDVVSAQPLDAEREQAIRAALEERLGKRDGQWRILCDASLIAGLRVSVGGWILEANLRDELRFFTDAAAANG